MSFLSGLLATAKKDVSQLPGNLLDHISHPAPAASPIYPAGTYLNVNHSWVPNLNDPAQNPTSVGRVWGTAAAAHAADEQQYTPMFNNIVMGAKPYVGQGTSALSNKSAGGEYNSWANQINLKSEQLDPYTITHEGLHAAYRLKTPQGRQRFNQLASQATPIQKGAVKQVLSTPLYADARQYVKATGNRTPLETEKHSYLPLYNQQNQSPALSQYYSHYFSNPNFYRIPHTKNMIQDALSPGTPQFSDWRDN